MTKLEPTKNADFEEKQEQFNSKSIENGRMAFRIRSQMLDDIPGNFKTKFINDKDKLKSQHCSHDPESLSGLLSMDRNKKGS